MRQLVRGREFGQRLPHNVCLFRSIAQLVALLPKLGRPREENRGGSVGFDCHSVSLCTDGSKPHKLSHEHDFQASEIVLFDQLLTRILCQISKPTRVEALSPDQNSARRRCRRGFSMRSSLQSIRKFKPKVLTASADHLFAVRLMQHLVVPTFVLDAEGRVLIWNTACERLTGLAASDVIGTSEHWRAFYDAPRPCLADLVLRGEPGELGGLYEEHLQAANVSSLSAENWCVMPHLGSRRYLAIDAGPIFSDSGELIAAVETLRDITAQREAELALKALASSDGLTGLANRRRFDEHLASEWRRAQRDHLPLGLLMIDVDYFKSFNDLAGHQAGDDCLRAIAQAIAGQVLRPGDQASRYGGEEFAVTLPNTDPEGAVIVADRILTAVKELHHPRPDAGTVTVSIGAASCTPSSGDHPASLIRLADAALYRAKHDGRDRVVLS